MSTRFTATIHTTVLGACPTCQLDLFLEGLPRSVNSDSGVISRDPGLRCQIAWAGLIDVDHLNRLTVLRLQFGQHPRNTLANLILQVRRGNLLPLHLAGETLHRAPGSGVSPVVIDDGITEQPVKPGNNTLFIADIATSLDASYERRLQDVFRC